MGPALQSICGISNLNAIFVLRTDLIKYIKVASKKLPNDEPYWNPAQYLQRLIYMTQLRSFGRLITPQATQEELLVDLLQNHLHFNKVTTLFFGRHIASMT